MRIPRRLCRSSGSATSHGLLWIKVPGHQPARILLAGDHHDETAGRARDTKFRNQTLQVEQGQADSAGKDLSPSLPPSLAACSIPTPVLCCGGGVVLGLTRSRNWGRSLELGAERSLPPGVRRRPSREPARAAWRCKSCCRCKLFSATRSPAIRHATRADIFLHPSSTIFLPARFLPSSPPRHVLPCYPHVAIPPLSSLLTPTLSCVITCVITGAVDTAPKVPSCVINSGTFNQSTNHLPLFIISVRRPPPTHRPIFHRTTQGLSTGHGLPCCINIKS